MPRKRPNDKPIKRRSRNGCHHCKRLKIKCDETKPKCGYCAKNGHQCDYSIKLSWGGRPVRKSTNTNENNNPITNLTNGLVLEKISQLYKIFEPVRIKNRKQLLFVEENPEVRDGPFDLDYDDEFKRQYGSEQEEMVVEEILRKKPREVVTLPEYYYQTSTILNELSPLPQLLKDKPFYRELFYHFLDVTADILVPVPKMFYPNNPFRTILPRMAVDTPHLLAITLAYSASQRARYLNIPEPVEETGYLLSITFNGLSKALQDEESSKSDSTLATAIMLTSYEILCDRICDTWRTHLNGVREIVMARGLADSWTSTTTTTSNALERPLSNGPYHPSRFINTAVQENEVSFFLLKNFAYLDIITALCSPNASSSLLNNDQTIQWSVPAYLPQVSSSLHFQPGICNVDYLLGIDLDLISIFSKASALIRQRMQATTDEEINEVNMEGNQIAEMLLFASHIDNKILDDGSSHLSQLQLNNAMFCCGVLIDLYRRALRFTRESYPVQAAVAHMIKLLDKLPEERETYIYSCMQFAVVTAGLESQNDLQREKFRNILTTMLRYGGTQIDRGKRMVELVWLSEDKWEDICYNNGWDLVLI